MFIMPDNGLTDGAVCKIFKENITLENSTFCTIIMPYIWVNGLPVRSF